MCDLENKKTSRWRGLEEAERTYYRRLTENPRGGWISTRVDIERVRGRNIGIAMDEHEMRVRVRRTMDLG